MKQLIRNIILIVCVALLLWGFHWARGKADTQVCTGIEVVVLNADSTSFVTPEGIKAELTRMGLKAVGLPVNSVNTDMIERKLKESEYLEEAQCVMTANGCLKIIVKQIVPVLRVYDGEASYYVNHAGKRITTSPNFFANVPVVTGQFTKDFTPVNLLPMVEYIENDSTLKALVTMICVRDSNDIFIVPSISGHVVNMGSPRGYENKFKKLIAFYKNVLPHKGYNYYDTISVKWDHQVVGTKRFKAIKMDIQLDSTDMDDETPIENLTDTPGVPPVETAASAKQKTN